jgi:hypothetical protein
MPLSNRRLRQVRPPSTAFRPETARSFVAALTLMCPRLSLVVDNLLASDEYGDTTLSAKATLYHGLTRA